MAAPDPYAAFNDEYFDPQKHWGNFSDPSLRTYTGQKVGSEDPSGEVVVSKTSAEAALVGVVDVNRLVACFRYCLGYNNVNTVTDYKLQRTNPICHPQFTSLVCNGVSARQIKPLRKKIPTGMSSANRGLKIVPVADSSGKLLVASDEAGAGSTPHTFPYYAGYDKAIVTARFGPARYRLRPDGLVTKEYYRNTIIDTEPRTEVLTLSGFQIIYAEGGGNAAPITNAKDKVSPGDLNQLLVKPDLKVTWYDVPEKFISKNDVSLPGQVYPEKIVKALGTLNRYDWISWKKGTLLCVAAHLVRNQWTLVAGGDGVTAYPGNPRESWFNYDIEFLFSFFDPPKGYQSNARIVDSTVLLAGGGVGGVDITGADTHGHNCLPYRGEPTGAALASADANAGMWFFATYTGKLVLIGQDSSTADQGIYRYTNFDNLFSSVWMPDLV